MTEDRGKLSSNLIASGARTSSTQPYKALSYSRNSSITFPNNKEVREFVHAQAPAPIAPSLKESGFKLVLAKMVGDKGRSGTRARPTFASCANLLVRIRRAFLQVGGLRAKNQ
jgi:hypothetical protein